MDFTTLADVLMKLFKQIEPVYRFLFGICSAVLAYFLPITGVIHVLMLCFILDFVLGATAGVRVKGEKFEVSRIWKQTGLRMLIAITIIALLYGLDSEHGQDFVRTHLIANYFFCMVLVLNISKNAYLLTGWNMFSFFGLFIQQKINEQTGIIISDNEKNK